MKELMLYFLLSAVVVSVCDQNDGLSKKQERELFNCYVKEGKDYATCMNIITSKKSMNGKRDASFAKV